MSDIATAVLDHLRSGRFDEIREMFAPNLRSLVPVEALSSAWHGAIEQFGTLTETGNPYEVNGALHVPLTFERGALDLTIAVAGEWIAGLNLSPAEPSATPQQAPTWAPPAYVSRDSFEEYDVTLDAAGLPVPGTLTLPRGIDRAPVVVLLSGSGPHDRDETIGVNKPFKDLAWGLASRGIATLRAEKVTFTHGHELDETFTLADEYLPHARAAVALLKARQDTGPVYLAGHSLGGTVAPRVAAAEPDVAGLILLAGGAQPMHWAAVRQFRYLAGLEPRMADSLRATADAMATMAARIDGPDLSADTPASELPFGTPATYWLDVRGYHPVDVAASLTIPILIVQGGRDYQVTVADDLSLWRAGLDGHANVTIAIVDAANHLLALGEGPSSPAEYEQLQHVDASIVDEIVTWIDAPGTIRQ